MNWSWRDYERRYGRRAAGEKVAPTGEGGAPTADCRLPSDDAVHVALPDALYAKVLKAAERRGMAAGDLVRLLVATAIEAELIDAVLDDDDAAVGSRQAAVGAAVANISAVEEEQSDE